MDVLLDRCPAGMIDWRPRSGSGDLSRGLSNYGRLWNLACRDSCSHPSRRRIAALEHFSRGTRLLVTPDDYFELIARQTSGATKDVATDELTWFAIEVVE